jgi:hypothetical protein
MWEELSAVADNESNHRLGPCEVSGKPWTDLFWFLEAKEQRDILVRSSGVIQTPWHSDFLKLMNSSMRVHIRISTTSKPLACWFLKADEQLEECIGRSLNTSESWFLKNGSQLNERDMFEILPISEPWVTWPSRFSEATPACCQVSCHSSVVSLVTRENQPPHLSSPPLG